MQILIGGVYWVMDSLLDLVPGEVVRNLHPRRPVVVVSGPGSNSDPKWSHVLVVQLDDA